MGILCHIFLSESESLSSPRRGEIGDVDWSPGRGRKQAERRAVSIVQNNAGNRVKRFPNVIVAVSTQGRDISFPVRLQPTLENGVNSSKRPKRGLSLGTHRALPGCRPLPSRKA